MPKINVIGLDMDGVLVDLAEYQFSKGVPFFAKKLSVPQNEVIKKYAAYDVEDIFDVSHKERMKFWNRYIWGYCLRMKPVEGASEMTQKWHAEGRSVKIITSRVYVMEKNLLGAIFRKMVFHWLKKNKIYYDKVVFCGEQSAASEKLSACIAEQVDLMVDDKVDNIQEISKNNPVLCRNNPWNQTGLSADSVRITNFYEVDEYIRNQEN